MTSEKPSNWGVQYDRGNNYYFLNVFEEIDVPGEWWIDKKTGLLYIYPPKQWEQTDDIRFASVSFDMLTLQNTHPVSYTHLDVYKRQVFIAFFVIRQHQHMFYT